MTIGIPDLTTLSLTGFFGMLLLVAAIDTLTAIALAVIRGTFAAAVIMAYGRATSPEHRIPRSRGGSSTPDGAACIHCQNAQGAALARAI